MSNPTDEDIDRVKADWHKRHEVVKGAGGLYIGTERHESRRIDNQLRGRWAVRETLVLVVFICRSTIA